MMHPLKATACFCLPRRVFIYHVAEGGDAAGHPLKATACFGFILLEEVMQQ